VSTLFEATTINGLKLQNRFVRSATYEAMAETDGKVKDQLLDYIANLGSGNIGLIITGHAYVTREGQAGPRQLGIYSDDMINSLKKLVSVVHKNDGSVVAQLAHAGNRGIGQDKYPPLGPSDVFKDDVRAVAAMTTDDIQRTINAFGDAAKRAVKSGFDGVQIHAAHGYLLSQFLSPFYNRREDAYGGSLENRARFLIQVYKEIRQKVGKSFPVLIKINSEDFLKNGVTNQEILKVCHILEDLGLDAVEMSGGTFDSGRLTPSRPGTAKSEDREAYYKKAGLAFKQEIKIPLIMVGGFLSFHVAKEIINKNIADYVALSRPLIREPHLVKRWETGNREKASCISCNKCFVTLFSEDALHCYVEKKELRRKEKQQK
jgi:2,4-dienoyl-CoA reductase-like NADH-dependent reductase (Old Yellow Enzyme family)